MPYFTTAEFRGLMPDMGDETKYSDALVEMCRDAAEALVEDLCGTSFIARTVTETIDGSGVDGLILSSPHVISITSVTVDGVAQSGYNYTFTGGLLERNGAGSYVPVAWTTGRRNVTVTYQAGWSATCPADLKLALMEVVRDRAMQLRERSGKASERATSLTNEFGNVQLSTADADHPTGLPSADAVIMRYARELNVFGFA